MTAIRSTIPCLLSITMMILAGGCGENHPLEPGGHANDGIVGHVIDQGGNPLAGIALGLVYDFEYPDRFAKPSTRIGFSLPEPGVVRVVVFDLARETVRTLADGQMPPGNHTITWDTRDSDGHLVPNGLYLVLVEFEGNPLSENRLFINSVGPDTIHQRPNALTDPAGYFRIPRNLIPVGEIVPVTQGEEPVSYPVSSVITLEVAGSIGGVDHYVTRTIIMDAGMDRLVADFVLPVTPVNR
ncbi:MAG: FlgD immunoglobulin-like domain containing protein [Candidatus Krumholzibacteriia bacterium]